MCIKNNRWVCFGLLSLILLLPVTSWATPRSATQARAIALNFMKQNSAFTKCIGVDLNLVAYNEATITTCGSEGHTPAYYIFNLDNDNGYIIVSGDDQAKEVLGYSDRGRIDVNSMSPNLAYWLGFYEKQITYAMEHPVDQSVKAKVVEATANNEYAPSVAPLLSGIAFNQGEPYNDLCPTDKTTGKTCVTGCVATAMASVMRYYKYPERGIGSHSYSTSNVSGNLSANFGDTKYDWNNILPTYKSGVSYTDEQVEAVATLMLHCGIALDMGYSSDASGTAQNYIVDALITYFGYNPNMTMRTREQYTYTEWFNMIKEELNNKRPVCYAGQSKKGGHSFILDGYDTNGKVHFDWGWDEYCNGYFELNAINPEGGGIGAGEGAYSEGQTIILRLQPELLGERESVFSVAESIKADRTSYSRTDVISLTCNWIWNYTSNFDGGFALALYTESEDFVTLLGELSSAGIFPNATGQRTKKCSGSVPSTVANGSYRLYVVSQDKNENTPSKVLAPITTFSYYTAVITDTDITLIAPEIPKNDMLLEQIGTVNIQDGYVALDTPATFTLQLTNTGLEYFKGLVGVYFRKKGGTAFQRIVGDTYTVDYNQVVDVTLTGQFTKAPGIYTLVGCYSEDGGSTWDQFPLDKNGIEVEVLETGIEQTSMANFSIFKEAGSLVIETHDENTPVEIYTTSGMQVLKQLPVGGRLCFAPTDQGVYIIRQSEQTKKVVY